MMRGQRQYRTRLIGDNGWSWIVQVANGAGLALFLTGTVMACQYWPQIKLMADDLHISIVAGGQSLLLK